MARKRRGRSEGSIYQRGDGRWVGSLSLGYSDKGGRRRRTIYGTTKKDVQQKLRQLQTSADSGRLTDVGKLTVQEYLARWLTTVKTSLQPKTHLRYEQLVRLRINPSLGGVRLDRVSPLHIESLFASLERAGVSPRGRQMTGTMLHKALRDAVRLHLIPFNPASEIAKPRPPKKEMTIYDPDQVGRFLDAARKDRLFALYTLALDTGMRQGELFALAWADIDLTAGLVLVQRSLEEINGHHRLKETKSSRGRRRIDLSQFAIDALCEHRKLMFAEGNASAPVFCDSEGNWLRKGNVLRRSFWPTIERANEKAAQEADKKAQATGTEVEPAILPKIRFHDLRHTCATLLLLSDENAKVVSERLGHASIQLTLDTYSHVLPTMQKRAAQKMDGILGNRALG